MGADVVAAVRLYIDKIVSDPKLSGMKVLLLDPETTKIVSMVYTQSQILEKEVFLVESLSANHERMTHLKAAVFVRPTQENLQQLKAELRDPKFGEYHIFFSNIVPQDILDSLAECDELEVVRQVQEFFGDYLAVNPDLFHLSLNNSLLLSGPRELRTMTPQQQLIFNRTIDGLSATLLSMKKKPIVRYSGNSELCRALANEMTSNMQRDGLFDFRRQEVPPILLILDRRDDPVTPLLSQWTYQAMLHELLGLEDNRLDLRSIPGVREDMRELVLSCTQDDFFRQHMYSNFGDLGMAVKSLVDDYKAKTKNNDSIQSIEDMQRFMENYPQFRAQSHKVSKHVTIMTELARLVEQNALMDVSQFEQEMACSDDQTAHHRELMDKLQNPKIKIDAKLRLSLLYALRYENTAGNQLSLIKSILQEQGASSEKVKLLDLILQYGGTSARSGDLFQKGVLKGFMKNVSQGLQGVQNVYAQHKPQLVNILMNVMTGTLREQQYPMTISGGNPRDRPRDIIVFIAGGVTFEEACKVAEINQQQGPKGTRVVLGGSCILNSSTFLKELSSSFVQGAAAAATSTSAAPWSFQEDLI